MILLNESVKPVFEFHISREMRDFYQLDESLFAQNGNVVFANLFAVRTLANKMNKKHDLSLFPEKAIKSGQLNAMGLIDEILHFVVTQYKDAVNENIFSDALIYLKKQLGQKGLEKLLHRFVSDFPPLSVYRGEETIEKYLKGQTASIPNQDIV